MENVHISLVYSYISTYDLVFDEIQVMNTNLQRKNQELQSFKQRCVCERSSLEYFKYKISWRLYIYTYYRLE